jgi:transcriptional regulator with XRE-family HTH domain
MLIHERLKRLRTEKELTQADIEERTGLNQTYISAIENGHIVPAVGTLEKFARALEIPMCALFYDGTELPKVILRATKETMWGDRVKQARSLAMLCRNFGKMSVPQRKLLLDFARKLASRER